MKQTPTFLVSSEMSGSRLGRGRVGRLALLGCGVLCLVFLVFLYRSTSAEMAKLKDLHLKCTQQHEALSAQLQVIFEYKMQLEKSLSNEKSANAAVKEELQKKASRERSLRDKDSLEAMQRFNSLQQNYKLLETEHQDLKDDCNKKQDVALENAKSLETTLKDLRIQLKKVTEDKETSMNNLKTKYMEVVNEKEQLEEKYNNLKKTTGDNNGNVERLQKQVIQLQRELEDVKKSPHFSVGGLKIENSQVLPRHVNDASLDEKNDNGDNDKPPALEKDQVQMIRPSSQQQVSRPSNELQAGQNPQPLQAPQKNRHLDDTDNNDNNINNDKNDNNKNDDSLPNELKSDIRFENRDGNIVPVGPNDVRDQYALPIPYENQEKRNNEQQQPQEQVPAKVIESAQEEAEQSKQVLAPPSNPEKPGNANSVKKDSQNTLSSKGPMMMPMLRPQSVGQSAQIDNDLNAVGDPNDFD